jgi:hypothetical protein
MRWILSAVPLLAAAALAALPGSRRALAEDDAAFLEAFDAVFGTLVEKFCAGPAEARDAARRELLRRGTHSLPAVLSAVETSPDEAERRALRALAADLLARRTADPAEAVERAFLGVEENGVGFEEFPPCDLVAHSTLRQLLARRAETLILARFPASLPAVRIHREAERWDLALDALVAFAAARPDRIREALVEAQWREFHSSAGMRDRVAALETAAKQAQSALPAEEASRIALETARWWKEGRDAALEAVEKAFPGTEAARLAQFERIRSRNDRVADRVKAMEALARQYPRTEVAAAAWNEIAFHLSSINLIVPKEDALVRLRKLAEVARNLRAEDRPEEGWDFRTTKHLTEFFFSSCPVSADSARTMLAGYRRLFRTQFLADEFFPPANTADYYFVDKLERLHKAAGVKPEDLPAAIDAELAALEAALPQKDAVRYVRAVRLAGRDFEGRGREALEALARDADGRLYGRKALATLAALRHFRGEGDEARRLYGEYLRAHPGTAYAWVAALRLGHVEAKAERWDAAVDAYARCRDRFPGHPLLAVLVPLSLGRAQEGAGRLDRALEEYRTAAALWPGKVEERLGTPPSGLPGTPSPRDPDAAVEKEWVEARIRDLDRPNEEPAALALYHRGKRLVESGRLEEGLAAWKELAGSWPESGVGREARGLLAAAYLDRALAFASREDREPEEEKARAALEEAEEWGDAFTRFAVDLARACLELRAEGGADRADKKLLKALEDWEAGQAAEEPRNDLEADVAAIREAAFLPRSSAFFKGEWRPEKEYPFSIMDPGISVILPDESVKPVSLRQRYPRAGRVLHFTGPQIRTMGRVVDALGGTRRTRPASVMAIPQPAGDAKAIARLLDRYFLVQPGHWGGWHFATFPVLRSIRFLNEARTEATVEFVVRYEGGEASLKKDPKDGRWVLGEVKFTWIE